MVTVSGVGGKRAVNWLIALAIGLTPVAGLRAEPVADHMLSGVRVSEQPGCSVVRIDFNRRVQYLSHFPAGTGDELRIDVNPLDRAAADRPSMLRQEALRPPSSKTAAIHAIELEPAAASARLSIFFTREVAFKVAQGGDFRSVVIAISGPKAAVSCNPVSDGLTGTEVARAANGLRDSLGPANRAKQAEPPSSTLSEEKLGELLASAQIALTKSNYDRAVQLLTKLVEAGQSKYHEDAQELLGEAREKRGQVAHARAEYKEYLRAYPNGRGAERVRQRLATLDAAVPPAAGQAVVPPAAGKGPINLGNAKDAVGPKSSGAGSDSLGLVEPPKSPAEWTISRYGSLSTFYNLNQGGRGFIETPRIDLGWNKEDPYRTYQSAFLSNFDYDVRYDNAAYAGRFKFSASEQNNLIGGQTHETRVSALYFDGRVKDAGVSARIGRQSGTTGGVLGRYDGTNASYVVSDGVKLTAIAGSPVERSSDAPFLKDSYFYGAGSEFTLFGKSLDAGAYFIEQRAEGMLDRRAIGGETRFVKDGAAGYSALEYDIHFGQLNSAVFTGNNMFADQSSASINLDYRRSPVLLLSNALQGQGVYTLRELLQRYRVVDLDQLAFDRTAESYTAMASYARPINSWLQWMSDVTVNYLSGMPASGGIEEVRSTGVATYVSTQLIASGVLREGDTVTAGLRYATTKTSDRYMAELGMTYPVTPDLRVSPMLRLGYGEYKTEARTDYQIYPTVRTAYSVTPDVHLELEVGGKIGVNHSSLAKEYDTELLILAGVRYDFGNTR